MSRKTLLLIGRFKPVGIALDQSESSVSRTTVQTVHYIQFCLGCQVMLNAPYFGIFLVPPVQTLLVQNKQYLGHILWDPQCFLRLRSFNVNPYGFWTGSTALQQLRQPVTMETRYCWYLLTGICFNLCTFTHNNTFRKKWFIFVENICRYGKDSLLIFLDGLSYWNLGFHHFTHLKKKRKIFCLIM